MESPQTPTPTPHPIDDSFLDWEHRHDNFPLYKHVVAGKPYQAY
jgi:hypothetical protein